MDNTYLNEIFLKHIDKKKIKTVFELGSRDCLDAIEMGTFFNSSVYSFECDPNNIKKCKENILKSNLKNINLIEKAVWDKEEEIKFYPVINGNNGASSCFKADPSYPFESYKQTEIIVQATTLDSFCAYNGINEIDYLCMDVQGAALKVFVGATNILKKTKYIICEIERKPLYIGEALFDKVNDYLVLNGFKLLEELPARSIASQYFSDFMYVNQSENT